jgi:hypothetical protein
MLVKPALICGVVLAALVTSVDSRTLKQAQTDQAECRNVVCAGGKVSNASHIFLLTTT